MLSSSSGNWKRLVAAVLKKLLIWDLCHQQSRSPSICSTVSLSDDSSDRSLSLSRGDIESFSIPPSPIAVRPPTNPAISRVMTAGVSGYTNVIKDIFLNLRVKNVDIDDLKERLRALGNIPATIISRKEEVFDRSLRIPLEKKNMDYEAMEKECVVVHKQYIKFIKKYLRITRLLDIGTTELDDSFSALVREKFEEIESKILTSNSFKLAELRRDISKLNAQALRLLSLLDPYQEKLFDVIYLPVLDENVAMVFRRLSGNKNRVGIVGPSGVGKTTVMWKLYDQLIDKKPPEGFHNIIWIPENKTGLELQAQIMLQLRIAHENAGSTQLKADRISLFLGQRKYLLLMDHVSGYIDLHNLGIRDDHEFGNVVIASNDKKAITMMTRDEVVIERLNKENSWMLFESICGKVTDLQEGTGRRIVQCCGGLPRDIKTIAMCLKDLPDERQSSWLFTKRSLESPSMIGRDGFDLFYKKMYEGLEMSHKKGFLYAALFPYEDKIHKDYLIECWMADGIVENDDNNLQKLRDGRDSGQGVLDILTSRFLLEWCLDGKHVRVPSIPRRIALQQEYPGEKKGFSWVPSDYVKVISEETWKTGTRISLIHCKIELPESPQCSNLRTLLLRSKPELCLYLTSCKYLETLPPEASDLKKLELLDIRGTSIPSLPEEIGNMIELRCLRASFYHEVMIPLNIIKNLKKLEELSIETGNISLSEEMAEELAVEIASLEYLTILRFHFPNLSSFNTFFSQSKSLKNKEIAWESSSFRSFKIFIGRSHETQHPYESDVQVILAERRLRFSVDEEFSSLSKELSKQASAFELSGNHSVETLGIFDLNSVEVCVVGNCNRLKNIVEARDSVQEIVEESSDYVLKKLRKLHLYDLPLLQCIWEGKVSNVVDRSHINLVVLTLNGCPKLTKILDLPLARRLPKLKHLKVKNCCEVSAIVEITEESSFSELVDQPDMLNSMESIEVNLPNLKSICRSTSLNWNSLNSMVIRSCSLLNNLSLTETNAPRLASIECEERWRDRLSLVDLKQRKLPFRQLKEEPSEHGETSSDM